MFPKYICKKKLRKYFFPKNVNFRTKKCWRQQFRTVFVCFLLDLDMIDIKENFCQIKIDGRVNFNPMLLTSLKYPILNVILSKIL